MNAYLKIAQKRGGGDLTLFECSHCAHMLVTKNQPADLKFCWACGVKFGPEPKNEPTYGEWYYDKRNGHIYSKDGSGIDPMIGEAVSLPDCHCLSEQDANGHLMAASKKLLAKLKLLVQVERPTARELAEAIKVIAEAEGKQ